MHHRVFSSLSFSHGVFVSNVSVIEQSQRIAIIKLYAVWSAEGVMAQIASERARTPDPAIAVDLSIAHSTITPELWARKAHAPNVVSEMMAMRRLADTMATDPSKAFEVCVELGLELCHADTCGISLHERTEAGEDIFRWIALAGQLKQHLHGTTPRRFSPCGICVDGNSPLLMQRPELIYKYLDVGPSYDDVLLIPLTEKGSQLEGTIWVVAHNPTRKFDGEDARVMQRLAVFTATALHLANIAQEAKAEASKNAPLFHELDHRIKNTLTMTAGLLRHQSRSIDDPVARESMASAGGRVLAMGLMHQIGSRGVTADLAEVIGSVCSDVVSPDPRFELRIEADSVLVPSHKATVVALIVNELVTNAVKHGFQDQIHETGTVVVGLHRMDQGSVALSVTDDGMSLPMNGERKSDGMGLNLIARLADQLGGTLTVTADPKCFTVVFPAPVAR